MMTIEAEGLRKTYRSYQKEEGLWGSIRGLVRRRYKETVAVDDVTFTVREGEFIGFLGPNGAGKTTTLKLLSGLLYPTAGRAQVLGYVPWERQNAFKQQFALVLGQKNQLSWDLPALESFLLSREIYLIPNDTFRARLKELAAVLDVEDKLKVQVRRLSLGERMKMELINSLLHGPRVLFLDEPTIGLDVVSQKRIRDFLRRYNRENGTTIVLTSHYMADIEALCERVIIINSGAKIYDGTLSGIVRQFSTEKVVAARFRLPIVSAGFRGPGQIVAHDGERLSLRVPRERLMESLTALGALGEIEDLDVTEVELEEAIRELFQGNSRPEGTEVARA